MELSRETDTDMTVVELEQKKVKRSSWNKIRPVIHLIPFVQMYKEKKYPWVQLAGHPGNFTKGVVQVSLLGMRALHSSKISGNSIEEVQCS